VLIISSAKAQGSKEYISLDWPPEYKWKVVDRKNDKNTKCVTIIPGDETVKNATIVGNLTAYMGAHYEKPSDLVKIFSDALDAGAKLSVIDSSTVLPQIWVIFKVETPKTDKYPEPESDLYYVVQGQAAVYDNHVAIKEPFIKPDFEKKWIEVFKTAKISMLK
jgi:hypothetical protein